MFYLIISLTECANFLIFDMSWRSETAPFIILGEVLAIDRSKVDTFLSPSPKVLQHLVDIVHEHYIEGINWFGLSSKTRQKKTGKCLYY